LISRKICSTRFIVCWVANTGELFYDRRRTDSVSVVPINLGLCYGSKATAVLYIRKAAYTNRRGFPATVRLGPRSGPSAGLSKGPVLAPIVLKNSVRQVG
jgi:hypothetical protein